MRVIASDQLFYEVANMKSKLGGVITGVVVAGVALGLLLPGPAASANDCKTSEKWVQENVQELPASYAELLRYPLAYRQAIYARYSPEVKSMMWQSQFEAYLGSHPDLSPEQVALLHRSIGLMTPAIFASTRSDALLAEIEGLKDAMVATFGIEEARGIIAQLGPSDDSSLLYRCSCSTASDYCRIGKHCHRGGCEEVRKNCGTFLSYDCDGFCN